MVVCARVGVGARVRFLGHVSGSSLLLVAQIPHPPGGCLPFLKLLVPSPTPPYPGVGGRPTLGQGTLGRGFFFNTEYGPCATGTVNSRMLKVVEWSVL